MLIGQGIDAHRFAAGRPLVLGGVRIPHPEGMAAHSDGDVVIHALCDALLGAAGLILFHTHPSGDPSPSAEDLAFTRRMAEAGAAGRAPRVGTRRARRLSLRRRRTKGKNHEMSVLQ